MQLPNNNSFSSDDDLRIPNCKSVKKINLLIEIHIFLPRKTDIPIYPLSLKGACIILKPEDGLDSLGLVFPLISSLLDNLSITLV